jgi:phosphatidylglycerol:prolipoprotein diacylglycerol transferase
MLPTLRIGPLALPTYPLLLILGFYVGLWLAAKVAARRGLNPDHLYNAGFYAAIAAMISGRLGHVILFFSAYLADPLSILSPNFAAFQPVAAALGAVLVLIWYQRKYHVPVLALLDALFVGALATLATLAFADALNGLNYGEPSTLPWAITQWDAARHPVQIYEMLGTLIVIGIIWRTLDRLQPGEAALAALGGYAAVRLLVDAFRDMPVTVGDGFRLSQIIAFVVLLVVLMALYQKQTAETDNAVNSA